MESVHQTASCIDISEPINLKDMLTEIHNDQFSSYFKSGCSSEQGVRNIPGFDGDYDKIKESVDCSHLACDTIGNPDDTKSFEIPEGSNLKTLEFQKMDFNKRHSNDKYALTVHNDTQSGMFPYTERLVKKTAPEIPSNTIALPELLLTVKVYHPTIVDPKEAELTKLRPSQEFLVIGHQYLRELRKKIFCTSDEITPGDFSENPDAPCTVKLKDLYPSGFFYINGTFYNDMQNPRSTDLSKVIREWAETKAHDIGPFTSQLMEGTQFIDLTIQLGYPYVYRHQGDCEHLFVFTEVRKMNKEDLLDHQSYPMVNKYFSKNRTLCMICQLFTACWIVNGDTLPVSPQFVCDDCLKGFFYTKGKKKNAEFELRKYCDESAII